MNKSVDPSQAPVLQANAMPAPTWHRLDANGAVIEMPDHLRYDSNFELDLNGLSLSENDAFEQSIAHMQARLDDVSRSSDTRTVLRAVAEGVSPDDLDIPALSSYQKEAISAEIANDVLQSFETGMGSETYAYLYEVAQRRVVLQSEVNAKGSATVRIDAQEGHASVACIDVVAAPGSEVALSVLLDSQASEVALAAFALRVFAGEGSRVSISTLQTASDAALALDDEGIIVDKDARVEVAHRVLGGGRSYTGLYTDLRGESSSINTLSRYLGSAQEERDFNYLTKHRGTKTESSLDINGVLSGSSRKTLRATIDFVYGCKGAVGNECETVMLADEDVENKTVPVILCDEDGVMGNHGATIGHIRPEQRLYLATRGLSDEMIERLFAESTFEEAALSQHDQVSRQAVARLAQARGIAAQNWYMAEGEDA